MVRPSCPYHAADALGCDTQHRPVEETPDDRQPVPGRHLSAAAGSDPALHAGPAPLDHGGRRRVARGVPPFAMRATIRSAASGSSMSRAPRSGWSSVRRGSGEEQISDEERDRRERRREIAHRRDRRTPPIARARSRPFAMGGGCSLADLVNGGARELEHRRGRQPFDPRPDPTGRRVAYVAGGALRVRGRRTAARIASSRHDPDPDVSWGLPEFIAAEEMERRRGYWWSPDGSGSRPRASTNGLSDIWHIAGAGRSRGAAASRSGIRRAGTRQRHRHARGRSTWTAAAWTSRGIVDAFPYLVTVVWSANGPLTVLVESRDQTTMADPAARIRTRARRRSCARTTTTGGSTSRRCPGVARRRPPGADAGHRRTRSG